MASSDEESSDEESSEEEEQEEIPELLKGEETATLGVFNMDWDQVGLGRAAVGVSNTPPGSSSSQHICSSWLTDGRVRWKRKICS